MIASLWDDEDTLLFNIIMSYVCFKLFGDQYLRMIDEITHTHKRERERKRECMARLRDVAMHDRMTLNST